MLDRIRPIYWIPIFALLSASWVEESPRRTSGMISLTDAGGRPILVHAEHVYAVHEGERRLGPLPLTRVLVTGRKPLVIRESVSQVIAQLAGDWLELELAKSKKPVFIDVNEIATMEASTLKSRKAPEPFSDLHFINGSRIRVRQSPAVMRRILGAR